MAGDVGVPYLYPAHTRGPLYDALAEPQQINSLYDMFGIGLPNVFGLADTSRGFVPVSTPGGLTGAFANSILGNGGKNAAYADYDAAYANIASGGATAPLAPATGQLPSGWTEHPGLAGVMVSPTGQAWQQKSDGTWQLASGLGTTTGTGNVQDMGSYLVVTQPDGTRAVVQKTQPSGAAAGAQFDYGKSQQGYQDVLANNLELQQLKNVDNLELQRLKNVDNQLAEQIKSDASIKVAEISRDASLSSDEKAVRIADINRQSAKDAAEATAAATRYSADLTAAAKDAETKATIAVAQGNWALAREQLASSERIAAAKAQLDREIAGLNAYTSLLGIESTERSNKAAAAAKVFDTLANLAPADQLRSAFYLSRGVAPPASATTQLPAGLLSALGVNPDTAAAASQQLRGAVSVPPWLAGLMGGKVA